ncbi:MAG TPA: hypothetical protein VK624_17240 [Steroidobacteraceae bacterium]|jgi:hypothetical protein|nr:hypothetical protein [Steroidobacteraceae bacterium]
MDLATTLTEKLQPALERFNVRLIRADATEAIFLGSTFGLHLFTFRDDVDLFYIERGADSKLMEYALRPLVMARFTSEDNAVYGDPVTTREVLAAGLAVYAVGLCARCEDLLRGEKAWLRRDVWEGSPANEFAEAALKGKL